MTYSQIEKTRGFIKKIDAVHGFVEMDSFVGELRAYYDLFFDVKLEVYVNNTVASYNTQLEAKDKASIKSFLESRLDENDTYKTVFEILQLIDEGKESNGDNNSMIAFVSKAYFGYNNVIKFDKTTEAVATAPSDAFNIGLVCVDANMVNGTITKLSDYGRSLMSKPSASKPKGSPSVIINNTNNATANASSMVDISIAIEQAKQQVEDSGFGDQQYDEIIKRLSEIESIAKSDESKGQKWKKAKEVLKWCTEQGIEIAKIVLPLLPQMLGK